MGLGFYGRSFTLSDSSCSTPGCSFSSGGGPGKCSASAGTLMFSEIQGLINDGVAPTLDTEAAVNQVVWDNTQWVSFDDAETFKMKIDYANKKCLGGTMVWAVSTDDGNYTAAAAYSKHNGLSNKAAFSLWGGTPTPPKEVVNTCGLYIPIHSDFFTNKIKFGAIVMQIALLVRNRFNLGMISPHNQVHMDTDIAIQVRKGPGEHWHFLILQKW